MKKNYLIVLISLAAGLVSVQSCKEGKKVEPQQPVYDLTKYVDPYIGTGFHGHVFLGACVPFGAVQLGPVNITQGWDWCSGYHYSDSTLIGFAHTHLSGTGIGDLGDILFMPVTGSYKLATGSPEKPEEGYIAFYNHDDEVAKAAYYSVVIPRYKVKAELTTSERTGFHQYTFSEDDNAHVLINLERGIGWDAPVEGHIEQQNDTLITGYRYSKGWANDQRVYFAAVFSKPIQTVKLYDSNEEKTGGSITARLVKADLGFGALKNEPLQVKVGISPVSSENALANMQGEIPHWDFNKVTAEADDKWNRELSKIKAESDDPGTLKTFYTALYHTMIAPSLFQDINGDYRGSDKKVHNDTSFVNYTTFSLWDTYRAAHPLFTLTQPERVGDFVNTMLRIYEQQGKLPVWHLMANETDCMVGYSAVPVIVDAYLKGFKGFDPEKAFDAIKSSTTLDERGINFVKEKGFIPADSGPESVARGLEYAISDACAALMAKKMGKDDDFRYFEKRGQYYKNYYDPEVGFMRGRVSETQWREPFDPFRSAHRQDDFCEGNAWQYTWLVPQDVEGLTELMGGRGKFLARLDEFFTAEGDMGEEASSDITGLIGQYAHGNEPSHHIAYLYALQGQPDKTADLVRKIMTEFYTTRPDGLIGNEDVGQMSAWYVLSAMGFYQVHPADGRFVFGSPLLDEAVITLPGGKTFTIKAVNNSKATRYIKSKTLNGKPYDENYISYSDIEKGGELILEMSNTR